MEGTRYSRAVLWDLYEANRSLQFSKLYRNKVSTHPAKTQQQSMEYYEYLIKLVKGHISSGQEAQGMVPSEVCQQHPQGKMA